MLRDRLVVGIRDLSLSEKLQTDPMLTLEKAKPLIRQKAAAKDHCHELQLHQMGSEAADLGRLGGHRPIQNRSEKNLISPFSGQGKRDYSVQDVGMIIIWQEINVQPLVQFVTNVAKKKGILVPTVLQSLYMQCLLAIQKRKLPAFWNYD